MKFGIYSQTKMFNAETFKQIITSSGLIDWLMDFNDMSTCRELFYA